MKPLLWAVAIFLAEYLLFVFGLIAVGRRRDAAALARFIPDCLVLFKRLAFDPRVPPSHRALVAILIAYLASPIDLVPDFIPVAGQLDDAILVALMLRSILKRSSPDIVRQHWPGPERSLRVILSFAGHRDESTEEQVDERA